MLAHLLLLSLGPAFAVFPTLAAAQSQQPPVIQETAPAQTETTNATTSAQIPDEASPGAIRGSVVDGTGAAVPGAHVKLFREGQELNQETVADDAGLFSFENIAPGPFQIATSMEGFATRTFSGSLHAGENLAIPPIVLVLAASTASVEVSMSRVEEAAAEIRDEEKQRVFGVIPNFYVTYNPTAAPLNARQKFSLAWKATVDPINFGLTGAVAGIEQADNAFSGYGQGAQGYAKRYGAAYADLVSSTFIGSALLPSIFKQDPRYFYKGAGSKRSRILYAVANAVICKGDNGHWQVNYSGLIGSLASGGISYLYYPSTDRNAALTFETALIGIGTSAAANILQEFVIRKFTRNAPTYTPPALSESH